MWFPLIKPDNSGNTRVKTTPIVVSNPKNGTTRVIGTVPQSMSDKLAY